MIATDNTNRLMDHRPAPGGFLSILDDELVVIGGGEAHVSKDAGLSWRSFDLQMP